MNARNKKVFLSRYKEVPVDCAGKKICIGDTIQIIGVPSFQGVAAKQLGYIFRFILKKKLIVKSFDVYGHLELTFTVRTSKSGVRKGIHWIAIEPYLVKRISSVK